MHCFCASHKFPVQAPKNLYIFTSPKCSVDVKNLPMCGSGDANASKKDSCLPFTIHTSWRFLWKIHLLRTKLSLFFTTYHD